jgi:hypothetical protein
MAKVFVSPIMAALSAGSVIVTPSMRWWREAQNIISLRNTPEVPGYAAHNA